MFASHLRFRGDFQIAMSHCAVMRFSKKLRIGVWPNDSRALSRSILTHFGAVCFWDSVHPLRALKMFPGTNMRLMRARLYASSTNRHQRKRNELENQKEAFTLHHFGDVYKEAGFPLLHRRFFKKKQDHVKISSPIRRQNLSTV